MPLWAWSIIAVLVFINIVLPLWLFIATTIYDKFCRRDNAAVDKYDQGM